MAVPSPPESLPLSGCGYVDLTLKDSSALRTTRTPPRPSPSRSARLAAIGCGKGNVGIPSCAATASSPPSCSTAASPSYQLHTSNQSGINVNVNSRMNLVETPSTRPSAGSPSSTSPSSPSPLHQQHRHHHLLKKYATHSSAQQQPYPYSPPSQLASPSSAAPGTTAKCTEALAVPGTPPASEAGRNRSPLLSHQLHCKCRGSGSCSASCSLASGGGASNLAWLQHCQGGGTAGGTPSATLLALNHTGNGSHQNHHCNGGTLQQSSPSSQSRGGRSLQQQQQHHVEPWFSGLVSKYFYSNHSHQTQQPYCADNKVEILFPAEPGKLKQAEKSAAACHALGAHMSVDSEARSTVVARWSGTLSTRSTQRSTEEHDHSSSYENFSSSPALYKGPDPTPSPHYKRLYDPVGPIMFHYPPLKGLQHTRAELRLWHSEDDRVISQNSSKRKVHRAHWLSPVDPQTSFPVAMKFVEDFNTRDGRSIKREIECHLYIHQRLGQLMEKDKYKRMEDAWPCAEMFGYHLDKKHPGKSVLVTRKLSGPDFFDVIRTEHTSVFNSRSLGMYEFHKLQWCYLAMERIAQYGRLGIRHNDIKPDNIVLDFYTTPESPDRQLDVKLIDLGTASMQHAKDFTGGTSWYESPEQKLLEFHTKKQRNPEAAKQVEIGLESDVWGAGLSITEVLMGRRVVDSMKGPEGPGPLEYRGAIDGWALDPADWVQAARVPLGLDRETQKFPLCAEAARHVFDALVIPHPEDRIPVAEFLPKLKRFVDEASNSVKRKYGQAVSASMGATKHGSHGSTYRSTHMHAQHASHGLH